MKACPRILRDIPEKYCKQCFYHQDGDCHFRELFNPMNNFVRK